MTQSATAIIEGYLAELRTALEAAGVSGVDEHVQEIRSLLSDAAGGDAEAAAAQVERLGDPVELARNIADRGDGDSAGLPSSVWWRLGLAAPLDIAIGLSVPIAVAYPAYRFATSMEPRFAGSLVAVLLAAAGVAWPLFVWRPWRRGGAALSPGMTLTGLVVTRAGGTWRLRRFEDARAQSPAPERHVAVAAFVVMLAAVLLVWGIALALSGGAWLSHLL